MFDYIQPDPADLIARYQFDFDELSLHSAILRGDIGQITDLLNSLIDVNQRLGVAESYTPLEVAVLVGNPDVLRILLAHPRIHPNVIDLQNHTVRELLYPQNIKGVVAEFLRCIRIPPNESWATYLINLLQLAQFARVSWFNLFLVAFRCENKASQAWMVYLLNQADEVDHQFKHERPVKVFEYACQSGEEKLIDFVLDFIGEDIEDYRNEQGETVIYIAVRSINLAAIHRLLDVYREVRESKLDINHVDKNGDTPLSYLLRCDYPFKKRTIYIDIINMFLARNADINAGKNPPLISACIDTFANEDTRIVELLLALPQTRVDIREQPGQWTALQAAAHHGNSKVVELLLKTPKTPKCSITDKDARGNTVIHHGVDGAVSSENTDEEREKCRNTLKLLLQQEEKWSDVLSMKNDYGKTALDLASQDNETLCLLWFKEEIKADDLAKLNEMKEFEEFRKLPTYKAILSPKNEDSDAIKFMQIVALFHVEFQKLRAQKEKRTKELAFLPKVDESKIDPEKYDQIYVALKNIQDKYCRVKFLEEPQTSPRAEM